MNVSILILMISAMIAISHAIANGIEFMVKTKNKKQEDKNCKCTMKKLFE